MTTELQINRLESAKARALESTETRQRAFTKMRKLESYRYTRREGTLHIAEFAYTNAVLEEQAAWENYKLASRGY